MLLLRLLLPYSSRHMKFQSSDEIALAELGLGTLVCIFNIPFVKSPFPCFNPVFYFLNIYNRLRKVKNSRSVSVDIIKSPGSQYVVLPTPFLVRVGAIGSSPPLENTLFSS